MIAARGALTSGGGRAVAVAGALVALLCASPAAAQVDPFNRAWPQRPPISVTLPTSDDLRSIPIDPVLFDLVRQLDDPSYDRRQAAMAALIASEAPNAQFYAILDRSRLSQEQRHRLLLVSRERLLNRPRGALGISMQWIPAPDEASGEVRIINLLPGLPAEEVLELGDRIVQVDGQPLRGNQSLVNHVQKRNPGDRVSLTVRRPRRDERGNPVNGPDNQPVYDVHEIDLVLGSTDLLRDPLRPDMPREQSQVEQERAEEARQVEDRWGVEAVTVEVRGRAGAELTVPVSIAVEDLDEHSAIRDLMMDLQRLAMSEAEPTPAMRLTWARQIQALRARVNDPDLTPGEQEWLRRVAERYAELVPD
jgi:hypothetical protein